MKIIILAVFISLFINSGFSQTIPTDSLYLGQIPPENMPKVFDLSVSPGFFATERIAISHDGKSIFYGEMNGYKQTSTGRIKYFTYTNNRWNGPFILFERFAAPGLSLNGDTMYIQAGQETYITVKNDTSWLIPRRILTKMNGVHYLQCTRNRNYYLATTTKTGLSSSDWSKLQIEGADTAALSLGLPLNSTEYDLDFCISRDESFMIITNKGLCVSYHKKDGGWTNPKPLGNHINTLEAKSIYGPFITDDNRYLFYTKYPALNNKRIHWIRIDNLIDSLKHTNFIPYTKDSVPDQTTTRGSSYRYTLPETAFVDDDGNKTLSYSAILSNDKPLPLWLSFDSSTRTFLGTPIEVGELSIKVFATDTANASALCTFHLITK
jgi:hypothetical protein